MREPALTPQPQSNTVSELQTPSGDEAFARAHTQAIQRLFDRRCEQREKAGSESVQRRSFLKAAGSAATALASWGVLGRSVATCTRDADRRTSNERPSAPETGADKAARFMWETVLFQCGQYAAAHLANLCNLPLGNPGTKRGEVKQSAVETTIKIVGEDPLVFARLYGTVGVAGPIMEEVIFRILPAHLLFKEGMQWVVGIPANFAFAAGHNIVPVGEEVTRSIQLTDGHKLSLDLVPLPQFMLGAYCWYVMKRYGDWAPILAHAINNQGFALSLVWGGRGTYREYQALLAEELEGGGSDGSPTEV